MFVTALLAATLAAPVPKAKVPELYFPTVEGTKWVFQTNNGERTYDEEMDAVSKVVEKNGKYTITVSRGVGKRARHTQYEVSADGVFAPVGAETKSGTWPPLLKIPAKDGDSWKVEFKDPTRVADVSFTVGTEEEVTVPAGKYKAITVTREAKSTGSSLKETSWYAPGIGLVKQVTEVDGHSWLRELKEFTPGKAK